MLCEIRIGQCSPETERRFRLTSERKFTGPIEPTVLTTHRDDVEKTNKKKLDSLLGTEHVFNSIDVGITEGEKASCHAPTKLILKIGYVCTTHCACA